MINLWPLQLIPHYILQLICAKRNDVFPELVEIHVCCEMGVGDGWGGGGDHGCPLAYVGFIDFFNDIFEFELGMCGCCSSLRWPRALRQLGLVWFGTRSYVAVFRP